MSIEQWLRSLGDDDRLSRTGAEIVRVIAQQPARASYATSRELAALAGVDVSSVIRTAQSLGFTGWPALRAEIRGQYLTTLSLTEIAEEHREPDAGDATTRSLDADRRALALLRPEPTVVSAVVAALAGATTRVAVGGGSYAAAAHVFANLSTLAGYRTHHLADPPQLANGWNLEAGDVVVAFGLWRPYDSTVTATRIARDYGATVCVVTDVASSPLTRYADHVVVVPSEGGAYFASVVATLALVNVLCAELAELDPARTEATISRAQETWAGSHVHGSWT